MTSGVGFAARDGESLLGFELNPLHNIVHLAVGGVYLLVGVLGRFTLGSSANILALNSADNGLHLVSAVALLAVGLATDKR